MLNKDLILKRVLKSEDKLIVSRILDKAAKAEQIFADLHSDFLDPNQKCIVEKALLGTLDINYFFDGGFEGAERVITFFSPNFMSIDEVENPFKVVLITPNRADSLNHRDYLGALMSLGIKREKIGDILVSEDASRIVVLKELADFITYNLEKVGNTRVAVELCDVDSIERPTVKIKEISATVSALRLDCIATVGFSISRSKIVDFIKAEKVNLNWATTDNPSKLVKQGDTISIRGKGRIVVEEIGRVTKKGRIGITLNKFI